MESKIYIVSHRDIKIPYSPLLMAINPDTVTGENIAARTGYSELRAHYWVWKNALSEKDMVGFFQFRRYLDMKSKSKPKTPYIIRKSPKAEAYMPEVLDEVFRQYDIIAPLPEYTGLSVWERYGAYHVKQDLQLVLDIIKTKYPEYLQAADKYLNGKSEYYGNLYIMRYDLFDCYCVWLFSILNDFDMNAGDIAPRTQGYLAERLFGIWFTKQKTEGVVRWIEVPRVHFWIFDDKTHHLRRDKLVNLFLKPGSEIRVWVKKKLSH